MLCTKQFKKLRTSQLKSHNVRPDTGIFKLFMKEVNIFWKIIYSAIGRQKVTTTVKICTMRF